MPAYQPELLFEALPGLRGHGPITPLRRFHAEPPQVALGGVPLRHLRLRQGVTEVGAQVEGALLSDAESVGMASGRSRKSRCIRSEDFRCRWWLGRMKGSARSMVVLRLADTSPCCSRQRSGTW